MSYASPKTVRQVAEDLGIKENRLYLWRKKYTAEGDKTQYATLEEENKSLRLQLAEARIEADMLKKATALSFAFGSLAGRPSATRNQLRWGNAYFANLSK